VPAASPAEVMLGLDLGWQPRPGEATVDVVVDPPGTMGWLQLYAGRRDPGYRAPAGPVSVGLTTPYPAGMAAPPVDRLPVEHRAAALRPREVFRRGCDPLTIGLYARAAEVGAGEAQVVRIRQRIDGVLAGGYTVVLVGRPSDAARRGRRR
jgi:hypothetical protein